jgi:hypothetical protein
MPLVRAASVARLDLAGRAAAVARGGVAIVALFAPSEDAVAACFGGARSCHDRAAPTWFELAGCAATIARARVAVVALLGAADPAIAALDGGDARRIGHGAPKVRFDGALGATPVAANGVSIIASLASNKVNHTITAELDARTRLTWGGTIPAKLGSTG